MLTSSPATDVSSRWKRLQEQYGVLGAVGAYWFGEPPVRITEHEPRVPWYVNAMIYATSLAMIFVFGLAEIEAIPHQPPWLAGVLIAVLALLFIMVYAMDRSLARTIPRIGLLWQRGQYALWLEHLAYAVCVGTVEATTYGLVIYTLDVNVDDILHGRPLIPPQSHWLIALVVVRAVVLVWTIAHAYLTHEALPPQWSTGQRQMVELLGGQMVRRIQSLKVEVLPLGSLARAYMLFLQPEPRVAWRWNRRRWRQDQAQTLLEHRERVVRALEDLDHAIQQAEHERARNRFEVREVREEEERRRGERASVLVTQGAPGDKPDAVVATAAAAAGATDGTERRLDPTSSAERDAAGGTPPGPTTRTRSSRPQENGHLRASPWNATSALAAGDVERPVSKPMPATDAYLALVRQARAYLLSVRRTPTVETVARYLHERPDDVRQAFSRIEEQDLAARRARSPRRRRQGEEMVSALPADSLAAGEQRIASV